MPVRAHARLLVLLAACWALAPMAIDLYLPGLPELAADLHISAALAQLTITGLLVGLAGGQVVAGPLSDAVGRRGPLLAGLVVFALASLACALATDVWLLVALRVVQGGAGSAGIVVARAIVRDRFSDASMARAFALLLTVNGLAPVVAPILGGALLGVTDWRGLFVGLAVLGALVTVAAAAIVAESLPPAARRTGGLHAIRADLRRLLCDRAFVGYTLACGLAFAVLFAYIAGSPFVLQDVYGLSELGYGLAFSMIGLGIVLATALSGRLAGRIAERRLVAGSLLTMIAGAAGLLAAVVAGLGVVAVLVALLVTVSTIGMLLPNATALALADHADAAGSASAVLGFAQFAIGGLIAPLVGVAGSHTAVPMAAIIGTMALAAFATFAALTRAPRPAAYA